MEIANAWSTHPDSEKAVSEIYESLYERLGGQPNLMLVHSSCDYDNRMIATLVFGPVGMD